MKKLSVAVLVIGVFVVYSLLQAHSGGAVLTPETSTVTGAAVTTPTPTAAGAPPDTADTPSTPEATTPADTPTPTPTSVASIPATATTSGGRYKNGSYTGSVADAQWGYIQVTAVVTQGKLTDVQFLQYPNDRSRSVYINSIADPELRSEAIQVQSAQVDIITGATDSSEAFMQSLADALSQAGA